MKKIFVFIILMLLLGYFLYADTKAFIGKWRGSHCNGSIGVYWDELTIEKKAGQFKATLIICDKLTEKQRESIFADRNVSILNGYSSTEVYMQEMKGVISNGILILKPVLWKTLNTKGSRVSSPKPVIFELKLKDDYQLIGFSIMMRSKESSRVYDKGDPKADDISDCSIIPKSKTSVEFVKKGKTIPRPTFSLEKGKRITVQCIDIPEVKYTCYIPTKYNPEKSVCIIINDSPIGNASPFAVNAAEELGWISIGLPGEYDATGYIVIRDIYKRFKISERGFYFSGFSEGGRRCNQRAKYYYGEIGGIVDGDMNWLINDPDIPICCTWASKHGEINDLIVEDFFTYMYERKWLNYLIINGGHSWGPVELHNKAIKWLARIRKEPGFFDYPLPQ